MYGNLDTFNHISAFFHAIFIAYEYRLILLGVWTPNKDPKIPIHLVPLGYKLCAQSEQRYSSSPNVSTSFSDIYLSIGSVSGDIHSTHVSLSVAFQF